MSMISDDPRVETFETPGPVNLRVEVWVGRITIYAEDTARTTVELEAMGRDPGAQELVDEAVVTQHGDDIDVILPRTKSTSFFGGRKYQVHATVHAPRTSNVRIRTGSADIDGHGEFGDTTVESGSGDLELDTIRTGDLKTGSGDIELDRCHDRLEVKSGSGDVMVDDIGGVADMVAGSGDLVLGSAGGDVKAKTGSGDIVVKSCGGHLDVLAGSGDLLIKRIHHGTLAAKTGSGDVMVGIAGGTAALLDVSTVSGDVTSELDASDAPDDGAPTVEIQIRTGSGDVVLQRS